MTTDELTITRAAGSLGAVVDGLDLTDVSPDGLGRIRQLLDEHLVIVVPGQGHLTDEGQVQFMLGLGEPYIHPIGRARGVTSLTAAHIVDDADHPPFQDSYHTDVSWDPEPPTYGCLRMIERAPAGGDTIFANMYRAYETLSAAMQRMLEGLTAWHDPGLGAEAFRSKAGASFDDAAQLVAGASHPVIGVHPATGRRYLYVNRSFTRRVEQLHERESAALLGMLFDHAESPNFQMRWHWTNGDVVIWDERCTIHSAVADHYPARREVARVNVRVPAAGPAC
jgi:taurine dioxygenase